MSAVDRARQVLIDLETQALDDKAALEDARKAFDHAVKQIEERERLAQERKAAITQARKELARAERLEAAQEQFEHQESDVKRLTERFTRIAQDKVWFTGTNGNDAIMPHQWRGCMFGAVAGRWLLGDGPGLGKTRQAIGWLDLIGAKRVVIVAEANICGQFAGEVMEYAPHREVFNLAKKTPAKRHELIDMIQSMDAAVVVVNYEIWRRDKDFLAKLLYWHPDTVIVDEAHNLKKTSTSNFKNVKTLVSIDNVCPQCGGHMYGLFDPEYQNKKPPVKKPVPCSRCGWTYSLKVGVEVPGKKFGNLLEKHLATKSVKNVLLTTGTPILNSPEDLFSLLNIINPILFRTMVQFKEEYLINNYHSGKWEFRDGALERLKPFIQHLYLARTLEDAGVHLPPQHVTVIPVDLDKRAYPKQYRTIEQITKAAEIILDSGESMTIMHLIALITRKRQANVWPGGIVMRDLEGNVIFDAGTEIRESVKFDIITDMIKFHAGERQIVFSQFKTALAELEKRLVNEGLQVVRFDGDTPEGLRKQVKANFDRRMGEEPKWDIVLANYKTGGTGLNFNAATVTHIMDEEWNPGKRNQAYGRSRRIGQTEETQVYVYRIPRSIDTWMSNLVRYKERIIEGFEGTMLAPDMATDLKKAMVSGEIL